MRSNKPDAPYQVTYHCRICGHGFLVGQGTPYKDEDIDNCWDCIDMMLHDSGNT